MTFSASANPIRYQRATPVFVDCDDTWTMDPGLLEEALKAGDAERRRAKAVIAVDLYGQCADYDAICGLCDRYGVPLVEDAAEALGATYKGRMAGGFGRLGVFSFNGNKIITTSGGGMLVSHDKALADDRAGSWPRRPAIPAPHYEHSRVGYNYRLSNVLAAIGRGQLRRSPSASRAAARSSTRYVEGLRDLRASRFMPEAPYGAIHALADVPPDRSRRIRRGSGSRAPGAGGRGHRGAANCGSRCTCSPYSLMRQCSAGPCPRGSSEKGCASLAGRVSARKTRIA